MPWWCVLGWCAWWWLPARLEPRACWLVCPCVPWWLVGWWLLVYLGACALVTFSGPAKFVPWCVVTCMPWWFVPWWFVLVGSGYLHALNLVPCWLEVVTCMPWWFVPWWLVCPCVPWWLVGWWLAVTCVPWSLCFAGWCVLVVRVLVGSDYLHALNLVSWLVCPGSCALWCFLVGVVTCMPWSLCLGLCPGSCLAGSCPGWKWLPAYLGACVLGSCLEPRALVAGRLVVGGYLCALELVPWWFVSLVEVVTCMP